MSDLLFSFVISILVFLSPALIVLAVGRMAQEKVSALIAEQEEKHRSSLSALFISDVQPREITILTLVAAIVLGLLVDLITGSHLFGVAAGLICAVLPPPIFSYMKRQRLKAFEDRLPVALDQLASAAKAGLSLRQSLEEVAKSAPAPVNDEFGVLVREMQLGSSVSAAISSMRDRMQSRLFDLVATALMVNDEKGGNLPEALVQMSQSLKEIWRLEQKLITASAEGRKAIWVISIIPIFVFLMTLTMQPDLIDQLTGTALGLAISAVAALLYIGGIYWLIKILRVDI